MKGADTFSPEGRMAAERAARKLERHRRRMRRLERAETSRTRNPVPYQRSRVELSLLLIGEE